MVCTGGYLSTGPGWREKWPLPPIAPVVLMLTQHPEGGKTKTTRGGGNKKRRMPRGKERGTTKARKSIWSFKFISFKWICAMKRRDRYSSALKLQDCSLKETLVQLLGLFYNWIWHISSINFVKFKKIKKSSSLKVIDRGSSVKPKQRFKYSWLIV